MKKIYLSLLVAATTVFYGCSGNAKLRDQEMFRTKTGVVGVFRQSAFYCGEGEAHYMKLGDSTVVVKPAFSDDQDNMFVTELNPGVATLYSYNYNCGEKENKFVLDASAENAGPTSVVVPQEGFCKIVISFLDGDKLFSHNDDLLKEYFEKEKVAWSFANIPYCDVVDSKGAKVSFVNKDSVVADQFDAAITDAAEALESEIYPLVVVEENSNKITWNMDKSKVLMITFHEEGQSFKEGLSKMDEPLFVFSDKEFAVWNDANGKAKNMPKRVKQLLGQSLKTKKANFTAFWVSPKDLIRPAYVTDVTSDNMRTSFEDEYSDDSQNSDFTMWFKNWFDEMRAKSSVKKTGAPWTRLGYTYDWGAQGSNKYGLTEFLVVPGAEIDVIYTKNMVNFLKWFEGRK